MMLTMKTKTIMALIVLFMLVTSTCILFYISIDNTHPWEHAMANQYVNTLRINIGKVFVVNLDRRIDRMENMNKQLSNKLLKNIPIERVAAVDGKLLQHHELIDKGVISVDTYQSMIENSVINGEIMTIGGLGCYLSHLNIWKLVSKMNSPALIFEDDITLNSTFGTIEEILPTLPKDFGIFYLANMVGEKIKHSFTDYNNLLYKMNGEQWTTSAYIITPAAASLLIVHAIPARQQIDSYIIEMCVKYNIPVFMSKINLVSAPNNYGRDSDVQRYKKLPVVIPKIFHRIWFGNKKMGETEINHEKMLANIYPDWKITTWNDSNIRELGLTTQSLIDRINITAAKSDIARYEILYRLGGVYIDTDVEPIKNIEPIIGGLDAFIGREDRKIVCNAIIGVIPGYPMLKEVVRDIEASWDNPNNKDVNRKSGPNFLTKYIDKYQADGTLRVFAPHIFYPYLWNETDPGTYGTHTYMVHHWSKQWWKEVGWKV